MEEDIKLVMNKLNIDVYGVCSNSISDDFDLEEINNSRINFSSWFNLFGLDFNTINDFVGIVDYDGVCDEVIDKFYEDRDNIYYFSCLKKDKIYVEYEDDTKKMLDEVFMKDITLSIWINMILNILLRKRFLV